MQRKEDTASVHDAAAAGIASGGGALPYADQIQASFGGHDISGVEAHTGSQASEASAAMGAEAYASGNHVVFGGAPDLHTAAHEAAHVVQQEAGVSLDGGVGQSGDAYEQHADAVADAVVQGKSAEGLLSQKTGGAGQGVQQKVQRRVSRVQKRDAVQREAPNVVPAAVPQRNGTTMNATVNLGGSNAENPKFEEHAIAFEQRIGPLAYSKAPSTLFALTAKVRQYIVNKVQGQLPNFEQLEQGTLSILAKCAETRAGYAGSAGADPQALTQILVSEDRARQLKQAIEEAKLKGQEVTGMQDPPSPREQFIFIFNFCEKQLNVDLAETDLTQIAEAQQFAGLSIQALEERRAFMAEQAKQRENGAISSWDAQGYVPKPSGQMITPSEGQETPEAALDSGAYNGQGNTRVHRNSTEKAIGQTPTTDRTTMTGSQMADNGMALSSREQAMQNTGGGLGPNGELQWSEGKKFWIINESDKWVQAMRKLSLPVTAGPSGHTNGFMNAASMLGGVSMDAARLVCIGQVLPINAHSLVEVLTAASAFGVPFTTGRQMYRSVPPLSESELRACGRPDPSGQQPALFPDEADPQPQVTPTEDNATVSDTNAGN